MSVGIVADSSLPRSMSSTVFLPCPCPVLCSLFFDSARGLAGAPGAPAAWETCWSLHLRVISRGLMNIKDRMLVVLFFFLAPQLSVWLDVLRTSYRHIKCVFSFIDKGYDCASPNSIRSAEYFLVQFSVAFDQLHSASLERKMIWWHCVCFLKWKILCR